MFICENYMHYAQNHKNINSLTIQTTQWHLYTSKSYIFINIVSFSPHLFSNIYTVRFSKEAMTLNVDFEATQSVSNLFKRLNKMFFFQTYQTGSSSHLLLYQCQFNIFFSVYNLYGFIKLLLLTNVGYSFFRYILINL